MRKIVDQRREFEYLLHRKGQSNKDDYIRYANTEIALHRLCEIRFRKINLQRQQDLSRQVSASDEAVAKKRKFNSSEEDIEESKARQYRGLSAIKAHIHFIFKRANMKWKQDISIYLAHVEFSKSVQSYKVLGKIYANALKYHPKNVGLWIEAASLEFFGTLSNFDHELDESEESNMKKKKKKQKSDEMGDKNEYFGGSIENARILLQRSLRINPNSTELYLQYFTLEYHYAQKMKGREEVMKSLLNSGDKDKDESETPISSSSNTSEPVNTDEEIDQASLTLYDGAIPLVIYKRAIQAIPENVEFRLDFLSICDGFPQTEKVKQFIVTSIEQDFKNTSPQAWIARAQYIYKNKKKQPSSNVNSTIISVLNDAIKSIPTCEMYLKCIDYAETLIEDISDEDYDEHQDTLNYLYQYINDLYHKANSDSDISKNNTFYLKWADFCLLMQNPFKAERTLRTAVMAESSSSMLWLKYAELVDRMYSLNMQDHISFSQRDKKSLFSNKKGSVSSMNALSILRKASKVIPSHETRDYFQVMKAYLEEHLITVSSESSFSKQYRDKIIVLLTCILMISSFSRDEKHTTVLNDSIPMLCNKCLQVASIHGTIEDVRMIYKAVLSNAYSGEHMEFFFQLCLNLERSCKSKKKSIRVLYDSIIMFYKKHGLNELSTSFHKQKVSEGLL